MKAKLIVACIVMVITSCTDKEFINPSSSENGTTGTSANTVTDVDGNVYHTIKIGTQTWMVENLKVTKYRDGSIIPNITSSTQWASLTTGAWCYYNNNSQNNNDYGKLYNWYTVNDSRGLAPAGWHVPSNTEWSTLESNLGGTNVAGGKLKETGTAHWNSPNTGATNSSSFTALPGGANLSPSYMNLKNVGYWWASSSIGTNGYCLQLSVGSGTASGNMQASKNFGFSVRCIKD